MADDKLRATPAARKLADDLGINLYDVDVYKRQPKRY